MKRPAQFLLIVSVLALGGLLFGNTPPTVTNVSASQRTDGSKIVDIWYSINDADNDTLTVSLAVSNDNGATFSIMPSPTNLSGAIGENILSGNNKHIVWNAGAEGIAFNGSQFKVKVTATEKVNLSYGLVAYYPFNGNANDESGNGNNGVNFGATLSTDRLGVASHAFWFDGEDYIQIPNSPSLNPVYISICAWFSFEVGGTDNPRILSKVTDYPMLGYEIFTFSTDSDRYVGSDPRISGNVYQLISTQTYHQNEWHFGVMTYDGITLKLFVEGLLVSQVLASGSISGSPIDLFIGKISRSWNDYFRGSIDDIRIYNRVLTDLEINALYHEGGWNGN